MCSDRSELSECPKPYTPPIPPYTLPKTPISIGSQHKRWANILTALAGLAWLGWLGWLGLAGLAGLAWLAWLSWLGLAGLACLAWLSWLGLLGCGGREVGIIKIQPGIFPAA
jgi:hypothetical protein